MSELNPGADIVQIYHPLNSQTPLYSAYAAVAKQHRSPGFARFFLSPLYSMLAGATKQGGRSAPAQSLSPDDRTHLDNKYRRALRRKSEKHGFKSGADLEAKYKEDERTLVKLFRSFFPVLLEKTKLPEKTAQIAVIFPVHDCFDGRCLEAKGHGEAVYITSRMLDVIELFANTLAMCAKLNGPGLGTLLSFEEQLPPYVLLYWMTMIPLPTSGVVGLDEMMKFRSQYVDKKELREEFYGGQALPWSSEEENRSWGHYRLSLCLTWLMLRAVNSLAQGKDGDKELLDVTSPVALTSSVYSLDSRYLATLVLSFIVLHEIGHIAMAHNSVKEVPLDPVTQQIVEKSEEYRVEHGSEGGRLAGTTVGHETAADAFALEVIDEMFREPMLEAATLWNAACAGTNEDCGDWVENVFAKSRDKHPDYAMRVWYLNGRFSSGFRKGRIARDITRQAEGLADALTNTYNHDRHSVDEAAGLFRKLWALAKQETC